MRRGDRSVATAEAEAVSKTATLRLGAPRDQPPGRLLCRRPWSKDVLRERPHSPGAPISLRPLFEAPSDLPSVRKTPHPDPVAARVAGGRDAAETRCAARRISR